MIRVKSQQNAKSMLLKVATVLGCEGDTRYFILDSKTWKIGANGVVYRSDDSEETRKLIHKFTRPKVVDGILIADNSPFMLE